jgi:hypothetical protein
VEERVSVARFTKDQLVQHELQETFPLNRKHVKTLKTNWDKLATGAIIVSARGGRNLVIDGRHRVHAASPGFVFTCHVMSDLSPEREADLWKKYNVNRVSKTALTRHINDVVSGDPTACLIEKIVASCGRTIKHRGHSSTNIGSVNVIKRMLYKHGEDIVFAIFSKVIGDLTVGKAVTANLIAGLIDLESRVRRHDQNASLTQPRWNNRLLKVGYKKIIESIKTRTNVNGGAGERHWADAILYAINHGLREHRLIAYGLNDEISQPG